MLFFFPCLHINFRLRSTIKYIQGSLLVLLPKFPQAPLIWMKLLSLDSPQGGLGVQQGLSYAYSKLAKDSLAGYNPWITFLNFLKMFSTMILFIIEKFDVKPNSFNCFKAQRTFKFTSTV